MSLLVAFSAAGDDKLCLNTIKPGGGGGGVGGWGGEEWVGGGVGGWGGTQCIASIPPLETNSSF